MSAALCKSLTRGQRGVQAVDGAGQTTVSRDSDSDGAIEHEGHKAGKAATLEGDNHEASRGLLRLELLG